MWTLCSHKRRTEYDIDKQIKNFWGKKGTAQNILVIAKSKGFSNATKNNPVDAVEFLHWLDVSCLEGLLNGLYSREPVYPPVAMLKAILLIDLKRMKFFTELARALKSELAEMLGFEKDGIVLILGYKNLWHFCNIRLKDRWDEIFAILRSCIRSRDHRIKYR